MAQNGPFLQRQADLLGRPVLASPQKEATALGAAFLVGLQVGVWKDATAIGQLAKEGRTLSPQAAEGERRTTLERWRRAVRCVVDFYAET